MAPIVFNIETCCPLMGESTEFTVIRTTKFGAVPEMTLLFSKLPL
ncbi:hypothetical protein VCSRO60_3656 [Vibrio cholerae]|nr:hypothetical protein VCSRO60_3656 [Vibrio cholerae]